MTLYICTAGTSIAGGPLRADETLEAYRERIDRKVQADRSAQQARDQFLVRVSAETNGLFRAEANAGDEVVLLTSETEDGRTCGERLVALVQKELGCRTRAVEIKGLQVRDGHKFRTLGIGSLFEAIDRETRDRVPDEVRLNATGGFKGTVPYLVLYGMFHGLPVSYVYELSNQLITLPPLAVEFDWERIVPAEAALVTLFREPLEEARWRELLPSDYPANRDRYDLLFEHDGGLVGLSAIGYLMKGRLDAAESEGDVLLSPQAAAALAAADTAIRAHYDSMLSRVRNPLHRAGFKHAESLHKSDLKVWKIFATSGPRMLYWTHAGRILVGELFADHDAYERYIDAEPRRRRGYDVARFLKHESASSPNYDAVLADIKDAHAEPLARARAVEDELRDARIELQRLRTRQNADLKKIREQAELRGYARGEKDALARAREELDFVERGKEALRQAYRGEIDKRDEEIVKLKAFVARLEAERDRGAAQ
jgi:putative CRISPR-associated protein (TIGR02619 family)